MYESVHPANETSALLVTDTAEDAPFEFIEGDLNKGLIVICDHASNKIPEQYNHLGLPLDQFARHIAYDIGAAGVVRAIARSLGVPALLARYSRLLIDLNRGTDDPTMIMKLSDGAVVPGNRDVNAAETKTRMEKYYTPYHEQIDRLLDTGIRNGKPPAILSVHSYTPLWKSVPRPWHATILWDKDARFPKPMLSALRAQKDIVTDDNVPYSGELKGDCMNQHGTNRGLAHALIEIRQDLIDTPAGVEEWAGRLNAMLRGILGRDGLNEIRHFGSKCK